MFGWFRSKEAICPVNEESREWLDRRWNWLEKEFGLERLQNTRVILPRREFFPDPYHHTADDVRRMLDRVCGYMEIDPATVELSFYEDKNPVHGEKGRQGTAGLYHPDGGKFRIWIEVTNVDDPMALVGTMAHELGHVHLLGHGRISEETEDHEPLTDLLTVFFGLGVFTANSVIRENYKDTGVYSSWQMSSRGYLGMPQYGYAFARFARARREDGSAWSLDLRLDVRTAFKEAMRFLDSELSP